MSEYTTIQVTKPTGALITRTVPGAGRADVVGTADLGTVLRAAQRIGESWRIASGRYLPASAVAPVTTTVAAPAPTQPMPTILPLSQRDKRWAGVLLGNTTDGNVTIGGYGCLLICYAMLVNAAIEPKASVIDLNNFRRRTGGFLGTGPSGGLATTFDVAQDTGGRVQIAWFSDRYESGEAPPDVVRQVVEHLHNNEPVIIEVDFYPADSRDPKFRPEPGHQMHFVIATRLDVSDASLNEPRIMINDPWDGLEKPLTPRFGQTNASAITRAVLYDVNLEAVRLPLGAGGTPRPDFDPTGPGVQRTHPWLGVHTLKISRGAFDAFDRGCRWFTVLEDADLARELTRRGARVALRHTWSNWMITPEEFMNWVGEPIPDVIYLGINESDSIGADAASIRRRAEFDLSVAKKIRIKSHFTALYGAASFAAGSPDFSNADVCMAIRDGYAEAYNAGMILFDMHNYVPSMRGDSALRGDGGRRWFARRWEFLFQRCGFDPQVRNIISSETGLDSAGGFIKNRVSNEDFGAFCIDWLDLLGKPLVIDNKRDELARVGKVLPSRFEGTWTSPYLGGSLFQLTPPGTEDWRDHNLYLYLKELQQVWQRLNAMPETELTRIAPVPGSAAYELAKK